MWDADDDGPFEGTHYRLAETIVQSRRRCSTPASGDHDRRAVARRKTLRLVARYARRLQPLRLLAPPRSRTSSTCCARHCDEVGRDFARIRKTLLFAGDALRSGDTDAFVADMADYAKLGIETVIVVPPDAEPAGWIAGHCAPAVPRLAELG